MAILMPFSCLPVEDPVISPAIQRLKWKRCMVYAFKLLFGNKNPLADLLLKEQ